MISIQRKLDIAKEAEKKSIFLFGPRQTGKTFLLHHLFPEAKFYNLLLSDTFFELSQKPSLLREELTAMAKKKPFRSPVIIDEIQKLPILLDEVHNLIESLGIRFVLTGSSPRKLRRGGYNLLGGRARERHLFPLSFAEIPEFSLEKVLTVGSLPSIYFSDEPNEDLISYCGTYLQQEIQVEGAVRNIENFSRFLKTAACVNTELLNYESIALDARVPARTIREYFAVLEDTLIGKTVEPYKKTPNRKAVSKGKFYFFDLGVCNCLAGITHVPPQSALFGKAFEHCIFTELRSYGEYRKDRRPLTFWRDIYGNEVDFLVGDEIALEVKATDLVQQKHLRGMRILSSELKLKHKLVVSRDTNPRSIDDILILPVQEFLNRLWDGEFQ